MCSGRARTNREKTILQMNALVTEKQAIDTEYIILENIYDSSSAEIHLRQRDLAQIAGASLGMTNSILKRLSQKGWITIKKLNSRNIQYAVTLEGINEIIHRSYHYFKRTIRNVVYYKDIIEDLVIRAKDKNIKTVLLEGSSDLDFIVEHACRRSGLNFRKKSGNRAVNSAPQGTLKICAENISPPPGAKENIFYLSRLIIKQAAKDSISLISVNKGEYSG